MKQVTLFTRQLATLITVSPLEEALRTISRQAEREEVRRVLGNVHAGVVEGLRLSDAMAREGDELPAALPGDGRGGRGLGHAAADPRAARQPAGAAGAGARARCSRRSLIRSSSPSSPRSWSSR